MLRRSLIAILVLAVFVAGAWGYRSAASRFGGGRLVDGVFSAGGPGSATAPPIADHASARNRAVADAAASQVGKTVRYDAAYVPIRYPGGDVPIERGACTDVVIRALRAQGVDLQRLVHVDIAGHFSAYPHKWGLTHPDTNIDHRRVPNLQTFFRRRGKSLPVTQRPADYQPGDIVTWSVSDRPHTGVVSTTRSADGARFCVVHNIGGGAQVEDVLFRWPITGHYRWF